MVEDFLDDFDGGAPEDGFLESQAPQALRRFLHSTKAGFALLLAVAPSPSLAEILRKGELLAHDLESTEGSPEDLEGGRKERLERGMTALRRLVEELRRLSRSPNPRGALLSEGGDSPSPGPGRPPSPKGGRLAALLVRVEGIPCLLPLEDVEAVGRLAPASKGWVLFRGETLPFFPARQLWPFSRRTLGSALRPSDASVVVRSPGGRAVLGVDRWEKRGEFSTRPVPEGFRFGDVRRVAFLEEGEVALVLTMPERWP
jgi:hypothetical protein